MEKAVEQQFNEHIFREACERFRVSSEGARLLGDFENYVYDVKVDGESQILRLTHNSHRTSEQVLSELEWVHFLNGQNINVSAAYPSAAGRLVEVVEAADSYFSVCLFEKADGKGVDPKNNQEWNDSLFRTWGETVGKMHAATKRYSRRPGIVKRPEWNEDELFLNLETYLSGQNEIIEKSKALLRYFEALPMNLDTYGLLHTDVHPGNFFIQDGKMTVFDFDDSSYHWFVSDIAIALYYSLWMAIPAEEARRRVAFTDEFIPAFLDGYWRENKLDASWLGKIPYFLKLRDIELYVVLHKKWDLANLRSREQKLIDELKHRIENDLPAVDVSFEKYV